MNGRPVYLLFLFCPSSTCISKATNNIEHHVDLYLQRFLQHVIAALLNSLTLPQTTNFGLFQTEKNCRRQFSI